MLNLGLVGLGAAGCATLASIETARGANIAGAVDIEVSARDWFRQVYGAPATETISDLYQCSEVDALWIASPTALHEKHVLEAAAAGKHAIVEKPMTYTLESARRMLNACSTSGVHLVCGGSRSSSATVRAMRSIIDERSLGELRALTSLAATDWMLRPRRPDEYDPEVGGGVVFRQAPHIVDSFRYLAGGLVRSVRGVTGTWMKQRGDTPGFFTAILEFENDVVATCVYSGHGYFMATELFVPDRAGPLNAGLTDRIEARASIEQGSDELIRKSKRLQDLRNSSSQPLTVAHEPFLADIGVLVVHCVDGELRRSPRGLYVYTSDGTEEVEIFPPGEGPPELTELTRAVELGEIILHDGAWGLATLEVCLGIVASAQSHRDVTMHEQVPVPASL